MTDVAQKFTLHTHTVGFDGRNTVAEMIAAARDAGFDTIGFSNHFIVHPDIKKSRMYHYAVGGGYDAIYSASFDEAIEKFRRHYDEIDRLAAASDIRILRGMEVDFFDRPQWRDGFARALEILKPDYCIGAVHVVEYGGALNNVHDMRNADVLQRQMLVEYWTKIGRAASSRLFNWMAHIDLPKKVGLGRGDEWTEIEHAAVRAIAKSRTAVEINASMYKPDCDEPYPSPRIMKMLAAGNVPVLLSDDAHRADHIGRNFERAKRDAMANGICNFADLKTLGR